MSDRNKPPVRELLAGKKSQEGIAHLLRGCGECRRELSNAIGPSDYSGFGGATSALLARLDGASARADIEREIAPVLVSRLLRHPRGRQLTLVRNSWQYQSPPLVESLEEASRRSLGTDPAEAVHLAELATEAADRLSEDDYGQALLLDTRGRARITLALSLRRTSAYREAELALTEARELLKSGTNDPVDLARLCEEAGELYSHSKQLGRARESFREAARVYLSQGHYSAVGRVLHRLARAWSEVDEPNREARVLTRSLDLTDALDDGRLAFAIAHNLLESLLETGQKGRALELIRAAMPAYELFATPVDRVIVRWTEARVLAASGKLRDAGQAFRSARDGLLRMGMTVEAALCSLDAAITHLRLGELGEVKRIAEGIVPTLEARNLGREALAAAGLFLRAAQEEVATAQTIQAVARAIRSRRGQLND